MKGKGSQRRIGNVKLKEINPELIGNESERIKKDEKGIKM
jgi:hypothetical protein